MNLEVVQIAKKSEADSQEIKERSQKLFGADFVVSRGKCHKPAELNGFVARQYTELVGLATYEISGDLCELVTIDVFLQWQGIGKKLMEEVEMEARMAGCKQVWLITTNDNIEAIHFYQRRGYDMSAHYHNAIEESRKLKPQIPLVGNFGIPIKHELEFRKNL
jgi:N-acetylglutamate synthase-like GNAT family acetyltransferase